MLKGCANQVAILAVLGSLVILALIPVEQDVVPPESAQVPQPLTVVTVVAEPALPDVELPNTYDRSPTAFTLDYPTDWIYDIPQVGTLVFAPDAVLRGTLGPSLVVQRSTLLIGTGSLGSALDAFLENGPLRDNRAWEVVGQITPLTVSGLDALQVELRGSELPDAPTLYSQITAVESESGVVYFFIFAAPDTEWAGLAPTFAAMLDSAVILD